MPPAARFAPGAAPQLIWTHGELRLEKSIMRIATGALIILLFLPLAFASAQDNSLGTAARRAQEEKKNQAKAAKVWDNDNIPTTAGAINVVGQTPPDAQPSNTPAGTAAQAAANPQQSSTTPPEGKSANDADLSAAKARLDSVKADADVLQRKFTLDSQTYYGKPGYADDREGAALIKSEKDQLDAKMQEVAAAQKIVDDLQAKLKAASGQTPR
jgi:hypothetical protein